VLYTKILDRLSPVFRPTALTGWQVGFKRILRGG
jgi:hypothetical protein